jgi:hypothetical protein
LAPDCTGFVNKPVLGNDGARLKANEGLADKPCEQVLRDDAGLAKGEGGLVVAVAGIIHCRMRRPLRINGHKVSAWFSGRRLRFNPLRQGWELRASACVLKRSLNALLSVSRHGVLQALAVLALSSSRMALAEPFVSLPAYHVTPAGVVDSRHASLVLFRHWIKEVDANSASAGQNSRPTAQAASGGGSTWLATSVRLMAVKAITVMA